MAARQRFIKPEIWSDPEFSRLSIGERMVFIGCFSNADDEGRMYGDAAQLRSLIFPRDDVSLAEVEAWRDGVASKMKNFVVYRVAGVEYIAFAKWSKHQAPRYAKDSSHPRPEDGETIKIPANPHLSDEVASLQLNSCKDASLGLGCNSGLGSGLEEVPNGTSAPSAPRPSRKRKSAVKERPHRGPLFDVLTKIWGDPSNDNARSRLNAEVNLLHDSLTALGLPFEKWEEEIRRRARALWKMWGADDEAKERVNPGSLASWWDRIDAPRDFAEVAYPAWVDELPVELAAVVREFPAVSVWRDRPGFLREDGIEFVSASLVRARLGEAA